MLKVAPIILICVTFFFSSQALDAGVVETNIYSIMSPPLRQFVVNHPDISESISNVLSEAFSNWTVQLYYYYTDSDSVPRASHYFVGESSVVIGIRENQEPSDQCICLIFEMLNSEDAERSFEIVREARSGKISRVEFARETIRHEFQAVKKTQKLLQGLKNSKTDFLNSGYYEGFIDCPDSFEAYLKYITNGGTEKNSMFEYEQTYEQIYDEMQVGRQRSNTSLEPTATSSLVSTNK